MSLWKKPIIPVCEYGDFFIVRGEFRGEKDLGVYWEWDGKKVPNVFGHLTPLRVTGEVRDALLSGLLHQAIISGDAERREKLIEAIDYFGEHSK